MQTLEYDVGCNRQRALCSLSWHSVTPHDLDAIVAKLLPCDCRYPTTKHTMNCAITFRPAVRAAMLSLWNEAVEACWDACWNKDDRRAIVNLMVDRQDLRIPEAT